MAELDDRGTSASLAQSLQRVLVDLIALSLQAKQLHWVIVGTGFRNLHLQLDELVATAREGSDTIAERMRALGAVPDGREATVTHTTSLDPLTAGEQNTVTAANLISSRITATTLGIRAVHDAVDAEDPTTADILHELLIDLEKQRWMIEAEHRHV